MEADSAIEEEEEDDDPELHPKCGGVKDSMAELDPSPSVGGGIVIADGSDGGG